jgi:hypothetical protein
VGEGDTLTGGACPQSLKEYAGGSHTSGVTSRNDTVKNANGEQRVVQENLDQARPYLKMDRERQWERPPAPHPSSE